MRTFLWVVLMLDQIVLLAIGALKLDHYKLSEFNLREQLANRSDAASKLRRQLHKQLAKVQLLQRLELIITASISVTIFTQLSRPVLGAVYALILFLCIVVIARLRFVQSLARSLFEATLPTILKTTALLDPLWSVIGVTETKTQLLPTSRSEFTDQLRRLPSTVLSPLERQRLESLLLAEEKTIGTIMTPKKRVVMVEPSATLGPIVLSDLQKSGHGYFPVATKKGEPEGILNLGDVGDIQAAKQRLVVREQMSAQVSWIEESATLHQLAQTFLKEKQYLVLVRNQEGEFSGVVTVADLMKHLLGIVKD